MAGIAWQSRARTPKSCAGALGVSPLGSGGAWELLLPLGFGQGAQRCRLLGCARAGQDEGRQAGPRVVLALQAACIKAKVPN